MSIPGHDICDRLKAIRREIAKRNSIKLDIPQCNSDKPCTGTCPQCENEVKALEQTLLHVEHPDIIGVGVSLCYGFDPTGQPFVAKNYLAEYRHLYGDTPKKIAELQETVSKLETELKTLRLQNTNDQQVVTKIYQHEQGIQNLNELITQLKR